MTLLVLLVAAQLDEVSVGANSVEALSRLGVTSLSLARDEQTTAVILEGWALDPDCSGQALAALGADTGTARALQPVVQMAVSTAPTQVGGTTL
jgi:hypothetical protein